MFNDFLKNIRLKNVQILNYLLLITSSNVHHVGMYLQYYKIST